MDMFFWFMIAIAVVAYLISNGKRKRKQEPYCSGQQKLATALEFFQNNRSDSFGVKPPLY